jgi:hypothetical protein
MREDSWTLLQKIQTKIKRLKQVNGPYVKIVSHQWWINYSLYLRYAVRQVLFPVTINLL